MSGKGTRWQDRAFFVAIGLTATIGQLILMRDLVALFYGNELLYGLVLGTWMAWVAAGAWGLGRLPVFGRPGPGRAVGLAVLGLALPAILAAARAGRTLMAVTPGALVEFGPLLAAVALLLAPICLLSGALFTMGVRLAGPEGLGAGRAYVWESIGAVAGGALFSFALIRWLDPWQTALLVAAADLTTAAGLWPWACGGGERTVAARPGPAWRFAPLLLLVLVPAALLLGPSLNWATLRWQWRDLVFAADSLYGRLAVEARGEQRIFYTDGLLAFETQGTTPEEVVHLPLLMHPSPSRVLLVGGGVAGNLREALKHPADRITYVELDPLLIRAAHAYLPPDQAAVLGDPRVRLITTDGRLYVKTTADAYDVVLLDLPEPVTGALNRFYTAEFFREVRAILQPGGILALTLPSAENYWSPELAQRNASIDRTLAAVYPHLLVLPGERNIFLASDQPLASAPGVLAARLGERGVQTRWVTPAYIEYLFTTDRFAAVRRALDTASGVRLNRDLYPISYYYAQALWAAMIYPDLRRAFASAELLSFWWLAVPFALLAALARWRRPWRMAVTVACAGFGGMLFEVVILFAFQVVHGYLYAEVSLIVTAYMAGLVLGGGAANRWLDRAARRGRALAQAQGRRAMAGALAGTALGGGLFPLLLSAGIRLPAPTFPLLALIAGCLGGAIFPLAVAMRLAGQATAELPAGRGRGPGPTSEGLVAGGLYGADLLGGCLAALLGATLLVPVLGIPQTCAAIALAGLTALAATA